jgi:hypothetical protein
LKHEKALLKGLAVLQCSDVGQALKNNGFTVERSAVQISARHNNCMLCSLDEWLIGGCFYAFGLFDKWKTYYARLLGKLCPRTFRKLLSHRLMIIYSDTF